MSFFCSLGSNAETHCGLYDANQSDTFVTRSFPFSSIFWGHIIPGVVCIIVAILFVSGVPAAWITLICVGSFQIVNGLSLFGQKYLAFDREVDKIFLIQTGFFGIIYQSKLLGVCSNFDKFHYTEGKECGCCETTKVIVKFRDGVDQQIDSGNRDNLIKIYDPIQQSVSQLQPLV